MKYTIDNSHRLVKLVLRYLRLEMVDKLSLIFSLLIIGGVMLVFAISIAVCLVFCLIELAKDWFESPYLGYLFVAGLLVFLMLIFYGLRTRLVTNSVIKYFVAKIFAEDLLEEEDGLADGESVPKMKGGEW